MVILIEQNNVATDDEVDVNDDEEKLTKIQYDIGSMYVMSECSYVPSSVQ